MAERVYVGMSGGVDSALAAALLLEQGHDVVGVYMRNWSRDLPGFACPWAEELAFAEQEAVVLGIDLVVWDCERDFKETVVDYLVSAYAAGLTPNPDVMCNQTVKFGSFAERAFAEGATAIATGHYAQVTRNENGGPATLMRAADEHKDQSYFLWRVSGKVLNHVLFPIGHIESKAEVRSMCAARGLELAASKPDSTGICFIGPVGLRTFLLDTLERRAGDIVEWETGKVLGHHDGAFLFTVGQRKGLAIGGGPARYVVSTDIDANTVYVSADPMCPALWTDELTINDVCWVSGRAPAAGEYLVRTRHTGTLRAGRLEPASNDGSTWKLHFFESMRTVAPGQSAVIYDGKICLGGGIVI